MLHWRARSVRPNFVLSDMTVAHWSSPVIRRLLQALVMMSLLALDEFEALDNALSEGRFSEASVLGTLRHITSIGPASRSCSPARTP